MSLETNPTSKNTKELNAMTSKKLGASVLVFIYLIILPTIWVMPVHGANNQGFEWGVEIGDRFNYAYTSQDISTPTAPISASFDYYIDVIAVTEIPDDVDSTSPITLYSGSYEAHFANGTQMEIDYGYWYCMAIGNWDLAKDLMNVTLSSYFNVTWTDTATHFGVSAEQTNYIVTYVFKKSNGIIEQYMQEYFDNGELLLSIDIRYQEPDPVTTPDGFPPVYLLMGAGLGIVVIGLIVVFLRKN
ncbi:MAG: hypothetical protein ACFE7R_05060 [Candidatus Hodarchaeota archaeon]